MFVCLFVYLFVYYFLFIRLSLRCLLYPIYLVLLGCTYTADREAEEWRCAPPFATPRLRSQVSVQLLSHQQQMYFLFVFLFVNASEQTTSFRAEMGT